MEELYTVKEVAERLKLSDRTIRRYIREGKLECVRFARSVRITSGQLDKFLKGGE